LAVFWSVQRNGYRVLCAISVGGAMRELQSFVERDYGKLGRVLGAFCAYLPPEMPGENASRCSNQSHNTVLLEKSVSRREFFLDVLACICIVRDVITGGAVRKPLHVSHLVLHIRQPAFSQSQGDGSRCLFKIRSRVMKSASKVRDAVWLGYGCVPVVVGDSPLRSRISARSRSAAQYRPDEICDGTLRT